MIRNSQNFVQEFRQEPSKDRKNFRFFISSVMGGRYTLPKTPFSSR